MAYPVNPGHAKAVCEQQKEARDLSLDFEHVAEAVKPSVVTIRAARRFHRAPSQATGPSHKFSGDDPLDESLDHRLPRGEVAQWGVGTGTYLNLPKSHKLA